MELNEDSDEGISNVEIDVDLDDLEPAKEEKKAPAPTFPKSRSIEDSQGFEEDAGTLYNVDNLTAKTIYPFEEFIRLGEISLQQEWEPEARIAYFRDRSIIKIEFTYEQRNNFREKRHGRGGKRGGHNPQGFRRTINED